MSGCNYLCTIFDFHFKAAISIIQIRHCERTVRRGQFLPSSRALSPLGDLCRSFSSIMIIFFFLRPLCAPVCCDCLFQVSSHWLFPRQAGSECSLQVRHKNFTITCQTIAKISLNLPGPRKKGESRHHHRQQSLKSLSDVLTIFSQELVSHVAWPGSQGSGTSTATDFS